MRLPSYILLLPLLDILLFAGKHGGVICNASGIGVSGRAGRASAEFVESGVVGKGLQFKFVNSVSLVVQNCRTIRDLYTQLYNLGLSC